METFTKLHFSKQLYSWDCFDKLSLRFAFRVTTKWNWSFQFQRNSAITILIVDGSVKKSLIKLTQTFDSQKQMMFCKWLIALFHPSLTNIECNTTLDILASLLCPPNKEDWKLWCVCTILYQPRQVFQHFFLFLLGISEKMVILKKYLRRAVNSRNSFMENQLTKGESIHQ